MKISGGKMKKNTANKVRLGAFISIGLVIFILAIYYIGQKQWLFTPTIHVQAYFSDVTGLQVGNKVRFTGINVGSVDDISIVSDTSARVAMTIDKKAVKFIKKDAIAIIGSEGLMGNKVVNIGPGVSNQQISDGGIIKSITPPNLDDIMAQIQVTAENASYITDDLATITYTIRSGRGVVGKLLMDSTYAAEIGQTLSNVKSSTQGLKELVPAVKHNFLLRGYYRKQEKAEAERKEKAKEDQKKKEADQKKNQENKKKKEKK